MLEESEGKRPHPAANIPKDGELGRAKGLPNKLGKPLEIYSSLPVD